MHIIKYPVQFFMLFCCMLALPYTSLSQARNKKETVDLLCHGWVSNFAKNPQKMDCFPPDADSSIQFLTNGYIIFTEKKGSEGVWNYDASRNNLYIIVNGNLWKYKINSLTATQLVIESTTGPKNRVWYFERMKG